MSWIIPKLDAAQVMACMVFCVCVFHLAYVQVLYPAFILLLGRFLRRATLGLMSDSQSPSITILIPAYNEDENIARKIDNTLALDYPAEKLQITVASDCSTDQTDAITRTYLNRGVRLMRNETQQGKTATLSKLASESSTDLVLITDANAMFEPDALRYLVRSFQDPTVGLVDGCVLLHRPPSMIGYGEVTYWACETVLRRAESDLFSMALTKGAMTAIRRELFLELPGHVELDHTLPLIVVNQGHRAILDPDARYYEETGSSTANEYRMRVRNAVRGFTVVLTMGRYLDVLRHPWYTLHVYSRKVLRQLGVLALIGLFVSNLWLLAFPVFRWFLAAQVLFYSLALIAHLLDRCGFKQRLLAAPLYFCVVNCAVLVGLLKTLRGHRMAVWSTER